MKLLLSSIHFFIKKKRKMLQYIINYSGPHTYLSPEGENITGYQGHMLVSQPLVASKFKMLLSFSRFSGHVRNLMQ